MALNALFLAVALVAPAKADIPPSVRAMIDAALASGNQAEIDAVVKYAKKANPDAAVDIEKLAADYRAKIVAEEQARLAEAGLLEIWSGRGEAGASRSTGNSDTQGLFASLSLKREGLKWTHELRANADLQDNDGTRTKERFVAAYEPSYKVSNDVSAYGLIQYEHDPLLGYASRYAASGGLGYALVQDAGLSVAVQGGPAFRYTELTAGGTEEALSGRAALDARWSLAPKVSLTQNASAYLKSRSNTLISATGLEARLIGALTARLSYNVQYESDPPVGRETLDTLSRVTLVYGF